MATSGVNAAGAQTFPRFMKVAGNKLRTGLNRAILLVVIAGLATFVVGDQIRSTVRIDMTPDAFKPVVVNSRLFDVSQGANRVGLLGSSLAYSYSDVTGQYPGISVFQSDPYFSDWDGNQMTPGTDDILAATQTIVIGTDVYYIHKFVQTIQVGARTRWNTHEIGDTTSYLSPFAGTNWDGRNYHVAGEPWNPTVRGDLVMADSHNNLGYWVSENPWITSPTKGTISSSVVPVWFPNLQAEPVPGAMTPSAASSWIQNNWGNKEVYVYPRINVHGLSNYLAYKDFSYNLVLSNGTTINVSIETQGASVGFTEVRKTGLDITGFVPTVNPAGVNENTHMITGEITSTSGHANEAPKDTESAASGYTLEGYVHPRPDLRYIESSTYYADVMGYTTSLDGVNTTIVIDDVEHNCGMPQDLLITPELRLKPYTQTFWTAADVRYEYYRLVTWANLGTTYWEYGPESNTVQVYWPFGVDVTNLFAIGQYTYETTVVTRNGISMVSDTGAPIDVAKTILDFGSSTVIKNPDTDLVDVTITVPPNPSVLDMIGNWLMDLFGAATPFIIAIAVILVAILVISLVIKSKRR